jgi:hypothetical protein
MFAKIVLASRPAPVGTMTALPLITMHLHYPDIIHGEVMTHRVFSRNARSMRAVPVATMVKEVRENPFVPWHWGKNQKGMQASEECNELIDLAGTMFRDIGDPLTREASWQLAAKAAADFTEAFAASGYHKQIANRIIAPYTWKHTLITSTSWANFFHLRDHDAAEPHFHDLAALVREAIAGAEYQLLDYDDWHLPYVTEEDWHKIWDYVGRDTVGDGRATQVALKLSTARAARISYRPFDGDGSIESEIRRHDDLVASSPLHASPTEHQAKRDTISTYRRQVKVHQQPDQWATEFEGNDWNNPHLVGNLGPGWIQYRKTLPGEYVRDAA